MERTWQLHNKQTSIVDHERETAICTAWPDNYNETTVHIDDKAKADRAAPERYRSPVYNPVWVARTDRWTGTVVIVASDSPTEFKRKQHAQAQKQQRDRLNAALDRIARAMDGRGAPAGTGGTKV